MKRALIALAGVGILTPAAWLAGEASAQRMSPGPAPSQAYAGSQMAPTQAYAQQRRARRSARSARRGTTTPPPGQAAGGYTPGSGPPPYNVTAGYNAPAANQPWEWHGAPGPNRRGNMCVTHTDPLRGYGYQAPCPPPKKK
jgi:hypothetical protein